MEIDRHSIRSITGGGGGGVLFLGISGGSWSLGVSQVGGPKRKKRECTSYIHPTKNEAFQEDKLDKGHAFNVGNCVMKSKNERGKHHTSSDFPDAHARAVRVLRNTMSCPCTLHMDMAIRVILQEIPI